MTVHTVPPPPPSTQSGLQSVADPLRGRLEWRWLLQWLHEDGLVNDAEAARAAGCAVFIVPYGYNEGQELRGLDCDAFIDDVPAALKFVKLAALH